MEIADISKIKFVATSVHKGRIAPSGSVFWVCTIKINGIVYTKSVPIVRSRMLPEIEKEWIEKYKADFLREVDQKETQPVQRKPVTAD